MRLAFPATILALLGALGLVQEAADRVRFRGVARGEALAGEMSAAELVGTQMLGGARALVLNYLWITLVEAAQDLDAYQAVASARVIVGVQPNNEAVWSHLAWMLGTNMAGDEPVRARRWAFAQDALDLLDQGCARLPHSARMLRERAEAVWRYGDLFPEEVIARRHEELLPAAHPTVLDPLLAAQLDADRREAQALLARRWEPRERALFQGALEIGLAAALRQWGEDLLAPEAKLLAFADALEALPEAERAAFEAALDDEGRRAAVRAAAVPGTPLGRLLLAFDYEWTEPEQAAFAELWRARDREDRRAELHRRRAAAQDPDREAVLPVLRRFERMVFVLAARSADHERASVRRASKRGPADLTPVRVFWQAARRDTPIDDQMRIQAYTARIALLDAEIDRLLAAPDAGVPAPAPHAH